MDMKKLLLIGIFFLLASWFVSVYAKESTPSAGVSENVSLPVDYFLPYPGLLPDSPFYFLRVIRDKVISLLIVDPNKKIAFDLLQADKRLNASTYLMNERPPKEQLVKTTVSKAENYFSEAISESQNAQRQGIKVNDMWNILLNSAHKHELVIQSLEKMTSGDIRKSLHQEEIRVDGFEKMISTNKAK